MPSAKRSEEGRDYLSLKLVDPANAWTGGASALETQGSLLSRLGREGLLMFLQQRLARCQRLGKAGYPSPSHAGDGKGAGPAENILPK